MQVPVNDHDPFETVSVLGMVSSDGNIVEQAEAHATLPFCMVTGRSDKGETVIDLVRLEQVYSPYHRTGRKKSRFV